jgi:hypothetical protein
MDSTPVNGLTLYYEEEGAYALDLVREACVQSIRIMQDSWQLNTPAECWGYVMTSLDQYMTHAPPSIWRVLLAVTKPLWNSRFKALWEVAGGWEQQFGKRHTFGVKPPHLLEAADKSIGERIFVKEEDVDAKVQQNTCHELTHAFSSHLKLPLWLKEGLAMVSVDKYAGKPTVMSETLDLLSNGTPDSNSRSYRGGRINDQDGLVYEVVRGYWLTRYIEDTQPQLLLDLLKRQYKHNMLENKVADAYGMETDTFWQGINGMIGSHFKQV